MYVCWILFQVAMNRVIGKMFFSKENGERQFSDEYGLLNNICNDGIRLFSRL